MTRCRFAILSASLFAGLGELLFAQAPQARHPAASNPHLGNKESIRGGMALYRVRCADCHGLDGAGYRGPDLVAALGGGLADERLFDDPEGRARHRCPRRRDRRLGRTSTTDVVSEDIGSVAPAERPIGNLANGERIYRQCASCHRVAGRGGARRT
jgi:mono/diheme cytochrome c family protein